MYQSVEASFILYSPVIQSPCDTARNRTHVVLQIQPTSASKTKLNRVVQLEVLLDEVAPRADWPLPLTNRLANSPSMAAPYSAGF